MPERPDVIDQLLALAYELARERGLTIDEAVAIVAAELERRLKQSRA